METENQDKEITTSTTPKSRKLIILIAILIIPLLLFLVVSQMNSSNTTTPPAAPVQVAQSPKATDLINQSLVAYNQKEYQKCIDLCNQAIAIDPNAVVAYSNICASYNNLQEWDKAIVAGEKAISIDPTFPLAIGNLAAAKEGKSKATQQ